MALYRANDLARYASEQVAAANAGLTEHHADALGLCRNCGRVHPCPDAQKARWLVQHYQPYVPSPGLVRPYIPPLPDAANQGTRPPAASAAPYRPGRAPVPAPVSGGLAPAHVLAPPLEKPRQHVTTASALNLVPQGTTHREE